MKTFRQYIIESEEYMYHGTNTDNVDNILSSGKIRVHSPSYGTDQDSWPDGSTNKRSYWSHNEKTVESFYPEHGEPVKLRVKKSLHDFKKERHTGDHYLEKSIPIKHVEIHHNGDWKPLEEFR